MIKTKEHNYREADYVNAYCNGDIEYILNDKTRVDCLTDYYAIEFDWANAILGDLTLEVKQSAITVILLEDAFFA